MVFFPDWKTRGPDVVDPANWALFVGGLSKAILYESDDVSRASSLSSAVSCAAEVPDNF
jgi:hypothetical protein